jgi:hypothetical protein
VNIALIDDQLLGAVLRGRTPKQLDARELYITGYWYVRLCQAVLGADERAGVLSRPFAALPPELRARAMQAVLDLPPEIGMVSLRDLAPDIARLRRHHQLNILSVEVLASATRLRADVYLSAESPQLEAALRHEGIAVDVLTK